MYVPTLIQLISTFPPGLVLFRAPCALRAGTRCSQAKFFPPRERVVPAVCSWRKGAAARLVPLHSCFRVLHVDALFIFGNACVCLGGAMCLSQKHADVGGGFSGFELALSCTVRAACTVLFWGRLFIVAAVHVP